MNKSRVIIICFLLSNSVFSQVKDTSTYHKACLIINKISSKGSEVLDVKASRFLTKGQVFVYFHLEKPDTVSIFLNDSLIKKQYINVLPNGTGDDPDYFIKLQTNGKGTFLNVYFESDKTVSKILLDKHYRVYQINSWQNCIYVTMKKYYRF